MISDDTIYYFASTIAQVLAATTALTAIFLQLKLNEVKKFLLGDGQSVYNRANSGSEEYLGLDDLNRNKLFDAIEREDLEEIEEIIKILKDKEIEDGYSTKDRPKGFQFLYNRYKKNRNYYKDLRSSIKKPIIYSLLTISLSIITLGLTDYLSKSCIVEIIILAILLIMTLVSIYMTYDAIKIGIEEKKLR